MAHTATIEYPHSYDNSSPTQDRRTTVHRDQFAAWGTCDAPFQALSVQLSDASGRNKWTGQALTPDKPKPNRPYIWVVWFTSVGMADNLTLEVMEGGHGLKSCPGIKVVPSQTYGPSIQYPVAGDTILTNLVAWGGISPVDDIDAANSTLVGTGESASAFAVSQPSTSHYPYWVAQFQVTGGQTHNPYALTITDLHGHTTSVSGLNA